MKRGTKIIIAIAAVVVLAGGGWLGYDRMYARPRKDLLKQISHYRSALAAREMELGHIGPLRERLRRVASTTLGSDDEQMSAALRSAMAEVLGSVGLRDVTVGTGAPVAVKNPAAPRIEEVRDKAARNAPDFYAMTATASGVGSLEAALRGLAALEAQAWAHRVDQWSISPVDKGRDKFELSVGITSIYFPEPDLRPAAVAQADVKPWQPLSESRFAPYRPILTRMAFKAPPPPPPPAQPAPAQPAQPAAQAAAQPYAEWLVTGVVMGRDGVELWLKNSKSGKTATLLKGERLLDATFVEAEGETATLEIGGARYIVALGQTLADRRAASR
jgi:hypothetical protein